MMNTPTEPTCPWLGPIPFGQENAAQFGGRGDDIANLIADVEIRRLNIVTGRSGVGKTSLLLAGVVPEVRRRASLAGYPIGPVLCVRQWGHVAPNPSALLVDAIRESLSDSVAKLSTDHRERRWLDPLLAVQPPTDMGSEKDSQARAEAVRDYAGELAAALTTADDPPREILLVVDQGEELMGASLTYESARRAESEALEALGLVFQSIRRVRLVIALREEFAHRLLRLLSVHAGEGGAQRVIEVNPLAPRSARDSIKRALDVKPGTTLDDKVQDRVLGLSVQDADIDGPAKIESNDAALDLLKMQALLAELWEAARRDQEGLPSVRITEDVLERYGEMHGVDDLGSRAILNWVLKRTDAPAGSLASATSGAPVEEGPLRRRLFARMAPLLSSGGVKRPAEDLSLVLAGIREDLLSLPGATAALTAGDPDRILTPHLVCLRDNRDGSGLSGLWESATDAGSGLAGEWHPGSIAVTLAQVAFQTLGALSNEKANVLKGRTSFRGEGAHQRREYELVHDGFGDRLSSWGRAYKGCVDDTLASLVAVRGMNFGWRSLAVEHPSLHQAWTVGVPKRPKDGGLRLADARLLGCSFGGTVIENVYFERCDLSGCVFREAVLRNCRFVDCRLNGTIFIDTAWQDVTVDYCAALSILFRGEKCAWQDVEFNHSDLDNTTVLGVKLGGKILVRHCSVRFAQILNLANPGCLKPTEQCNLQRSFFPQYADANVAGECTVDATIADEPSSVREAGPRPRGA